jgi:hypothetical protein
LLKNVSYEENTRQKNEKKKKELKQQRRHSQFCRQNHIGARSAEADPSQYKPYPIIKQNMNTAAPFCNQ